MAARGWAGGARFGVWLPAGWPAGSFSSPNHGARALSWRRVLLGSKPRRTFRRMLVWSTGMLLLFNYLLVPIKVTGASMTPTYRDGSVNFLNRLSYTKRAPRRGDVVVLRDHNEFILKRVIAVPGETVTLVGGVFQINGKPLADPFSQSRIDDAFTPVTLRANQYFVIGDNRNYSMFGKFERQQILGKIVF